MRLIRSYCQKCIKHVSCVRTSGSSIDGPWWTWRRIVLLCLFFPCWCWIGGVGHLFGDVLDLHPFGTNLGLLKVSQLFVIETGMLSSECMLHRMHIWFFKEWLDNPIKWESMLKWSSCWSHEGSCLEGYFANLSPGSDHWSIIIPGK